MADITRTDAGALIDVENTQKVWEEVAKQSLAMQLFNTVTMRSNTQRLDLLETLPSSSGSAFVTGDTGRKQTLKMAWANKTMTAEEIAGIVPIPESVLEDSSVDLWALIRPRISEYIARYLDAAVLLGTGAPASWPSGGLAGGAVSAGNTLNLSDYAGAASTGDDRFSAYNDLIGMVEDDGYEPNALITRRAERRLIRNLRDADGNPIYSDGFAQGSNVPSLLGVDVSYVNNLAMGAAPSGATDVVSIAGDRDKAIIGLRTGIEYKLLDQASLTEDVTVRNAAGDGTTVIKVPTINLAEQDMVALRFRFRVGFEIADPTTLEGGSGAYPFAVLRVGP